MVGRKSLWVLWSFKLFHRIKFGTNFNSKKDATKKTIFEDLDQRSHDQWHSLRDMSKKMKKINENFEEMMRLNAKLDVLGGDVNNMNQYIHAI